MRDYFSELYEWDEDDNKRRKKRVARDRERIHFPVTVMDAARGAFRPTFSDGTPDHTSPFKPGYRFADVGDAARLAADEAYEQRRQLMHYANRQRQQYADASPDVRDAALPRTRTLDEWRAKADQAWEERSKRMANAWRHD